MTRLTSNDSFYVTSQTKPACSRARVSTLPWLLGPGNFGSTSSHLYFLSWHRDVTDAGNTKRFFLGTPSVACRGHDPGGTSAEARKVPALTSKNAQFFF